MRYAALHGHEAGDATLTLVGLVSAYREGPLGCSAVRSLLSACDSVLVAEGPVAGNEPSREEWREFAKHNRVTVMYGEWATDADKRTHLLERAKQRRAKWGLVVDGDELLVWGEHLADTIHFMEQAEAVQGKTMMGLPIRLVEHDGSCAAATNRILRLDYIERYLFSSYHLLLTNGVEVSKPHIPLVLAGDPDLAPVERAEMFQRRRPLHGEPHLYHRSFLRDPARAARRLHQQETDDLTAMAERIGVAGEKPRFDEGVRIYLPAKGG
jgi:hypothetical protein